MIESIAIEGFRGIAKGKVDGLSQVSVLLGRNGSGKSTVLEAIYIVSSWARLRDPLRDVDKLNYVISRRGGSGDWDSSREILWFSMDTSRDIAIELSVDGYTYRFRIIARAKPCAWLEIDDEVRKSLGLETHIRYLCYPYMTALTARDTPQLINIDIMASEKLSRLYQALEDTLLIDSRLLTTLRGIEKSCWSKVVAKRLDKIIVEMLRDEFEPDAEGLTYIPIGDTYALALQLSKTSVRIDDLGDGAKLAIVTALAILGHKPRILLIEEPETHMHPAGLATYLRFVLRLAKELGAQVIMSSHSLELVKIARKICSELGLELSIHFLERDSEGVLTSRRITAMDSEILEKLGLDIRFLYTV